MPMACTIAAKSGSASIGTWPISCRRRGEGGGSEGGGEVGRRRAAGVALRGRVRSTGAGTGSHQGSVPTGAPRRATHLVAHVGLRRVHRLRRARGKGGGRVPVAPGQRALRHLPHGPRMRASRPLARISPLTPPQPRTAPAEHPPPLAASTPTPPPPTRARRAPHLAVVAHVLGAVEILEREAVQKVARVHQARDGPDLRARGQGVRRVGAAGRGRRGAAGAGQHEPRRECACGGYAPFRSRGRGAHHPSTPTRLGPLSRPHRPLTVQIPRLTPLRHLGPSGRGEHAA